MVAMVQVRAAAAAVECRPSPPAAHRRETRAMAVNAFWSAVRFTHADAEMDSRVPIVKTVEY